MKLVSVAIGATLLISCASNTVPQRAQVQVRDIIATQPVIKEAREQQKAPIENSYDRIKVEDLSAEEINSSRAQYYDQQAQSQVNRVAQINSALSAAEYYIQAEDFKGAERASSGLFNDSLDLIQTDRLTIISAYVANAKGEHQNAISLLAPLWERQSQPLETDALELDVPERETADTLELDELESGREVALATIPEKETLSIQQIDALLLGSFSYQALGDYDSAIKALITREHSLTGSSRNETTRYIWQVITSLPIEHRQIIFQNTQNLLVKNRIEQSLSTQLAPIAQQPKQFSQWREDPKSIAKQAIDDAWNVNSPTNIAVLLPITSKFNKAAQAVKDGLNYQHNSNQSSYRPILRFYDIGDNSLAVNQYYAAALKSGADFIIGPLGKEYANQISQRESLYNDNAQDNYQVDNAVRANRVPTLLLGGDLPLNWPTSRFTMSPEMEGALVAEQAWRNGHLSAALLVNQSASSDRTVASFTQKWLSLGGKISKTVSYLPKQYDHSAELKELFDINKSQSRHKSLSTTLGFSPKFSAYQRSDIDFIFMIANTETGRLIRPQVNFFSGSKIPVYATSSIFNGLQDEVNNVDLDGTRFPVMPWVLKSAEIAPYAGQLNMLFALGSDAYRVSTSYQALHQDSSLAINGNTGQVSISHYGETVYQPVWASFKNGKVVPIETLGLDISPITELNNPVLNSIDVNGTYDDSTYNSQTWDSQKGVRKQTQEGKQQNTEEDARGSR